MGWGRRGAFGEVRLVKSKTNGDIYAMKSMIKEAMVRKNQVRWTVGRGAREAKGGGGEGSHISLPDSLR